MFVPDNKKQLGCVDKFQFRTCNQLYKEGDLQIFLHHIYEYEKGIRNLVLHTLSQKYDVFIKAKLEKKRIRYHIQYLQNARMNIFWGSEYCINTLKHFGDKNLKDFSDEEDFILGIMLGYDRIRQCQRYINRKNRKGDKT